MKRRKIRILSLSWRINMNFKQGCVLIFLTFSNICLAQSQTLDTLMRSLAFTDDKGIRETALNYVVNHPEVAKEILFFPDPEFFQNAAKHNAFVCLKTSSYKGLISPEEFFDVCYRLIANIGLYHPPEERDRSLKWYSTGLANYNWTERDGSLQDLMRLFENLSKTLIAMEKNGLILNPGLKNSFAVKINGAKDAIEKHQTKGTTQAISKIEAARNEASAQKGKQFNEAACTIFLIYCKNLIWQINHTIF